jgi:hypothetical protein
VRATVGSVPAGAASTRRYRTGARLDSGHDRSTVLRAVDQIRSPGENPADYWRRFHGAEERVDGEPFCCARRRRTTSAGRSWA